mgnify:CR=1 FL=1
MMMTVTRLTTTTTMMMTATTELAAINGWIVLDKPLALSSAQGVAAVKRILRTNGLPVPRIGHGGTLDPLATGMLPICLGEATKVAGEILEGAKQPSGYTEPILHRRRRELKASLGL